jgi:hypothetical protein
MFNRFLIMSSRSRMPIPLDDFFFLKINYLSFPSHGLARLLPLFGQAAVVALSNQRTAMAAIQGSRLWLLGFF